MCPEQDVLSEYFDKELPDIWEKKMEQHLAVCPECNKRLASYAHIAGALGGAKDDAGVEAVRLRVWQNLSQEGKRPRYAERTIWHQSINVPLPAALAAAAAVIFAFSLSALLLLTRAPEHTVPMDSFAAIDLQTPLVSPVSTMGDVLRYLESENGSDFVILRLPESRNFNTYGDPKIINAANYHARRPGLQ
jgi:anti-sigma factor RsiW